MESPAWPPSAFANPVQPFNSQDLSRPNTRCPRTPRTPSTGVPVHHLRHNRRIVRSSADRPEGTPPSPESLPNSPPPDHFPTGSSAREVPSCSPAEVFLVGTGPGDPSLLTLRAAQLMADADVVLYDRLVSQDILRMINPSARMVYVGKKTSFHTRPQPEIHTLLARFATDGHYKTVIRLKGGDPYVFGRGGEEMEYLEDRGVRVTCVPGITSAAGIGAELGIPLTHRGVATSVRFLTGHLGAESGDLDDGEMVVGRRTTLVVYMGLATLPGMAERLVQMGLDRATPAVAVERGTTPQQRQVFATLQELPRKVAEASLESPTLIIIGGVVALSRHWKTRARADMQTRTSSASAVLVAESGMVNADDTAAA